MNTEILNISMKMIIGEDVTEAEAKQVKAYDLKYALVKYIYMEKRKHSDPENGPVLTRFHFTPGDGFMEAPIYDIVHGLIQVDLSVRDGDGKRNPPVTGIEKSELI
jgi:hypothetical protein